MLDVIVEDLPDDEILDAVLGFARSARQMTLREQVYVYRASVEQLKREAGRSQGRPRSQTSPKGEEYLAPQEIRSQAAKQARFSSAKHAERADAVFARAPEDLLDQVNRGEVSVTAAYAKIPKQERAKPAPRQSSAGAKPDAEPNGSMGSALRVGIPTHANPFVTSNRTNAPSSSETGHEPRVISEESTPTVETTVVSTPSPALAEEPLDLDDPEDEPTLDPSDHLEALCAYLQGLRAGEDDDDLSDQERYEQARAEAEAFVEQLLGAIGEPAEFEDEEAPISSPWADLEAEEAALLA